MARGFDFETTLGVCWSKEEGDWKIYFPRRADGWYIYSVLSKQLFKDLFKELEDAGYDLDSFRFSIKRKELGKPKRSNHFDYETTLGICWSKRMDDWKVYYPVKSDGWILHDFARNLSLKEWMKELEKRGYEPETFKLWVKKKIRNNNG